MGDLVLLVIGFSVLAFSGFTMNSHMGKMTVLSVVVALIVDFLFLPPLLIKLEGRKNAKVCALKRFLNDFGYKILWRRSKQMMRVLVMVVWVLDWVLYSGLAETPEEKGLAIARWRMTKGITDSSTTRPIWK